MIFTVNHPSASSSSNELLLVDVRLTANGKCISGRALLDPGSTISTVAVHIVRKNGIARTSSDTKIKTLNRRVLGITDQLLLDVMNHKCTLPLYAVDSEFDFILGLNWFQALNALNAIKQH